MATTKKATESKEDVKVTATKVETTAATKETTVTPEVPVAEEKKAPAKKTAATKKTTTKKVAEKKPTEKKPAEKKTTTRTTKPKELKANVVIQYRDAEVAESVLMDRFKATWESMGRTEKEIKDLTVYVKPEEYKAYFVVNSIDTVQVQM